MFSFSFNVYMFWKIFFSNKIGLILEKPLFLYYLWTISVSFILSNFIQLTKLIIKQNQLLEPKWRVKNTISLLLRIYLTVRSLKHTIKQSSLLWHIVNYSPKIFMELLIDGKWAPPSHFPPPLCNKFPHS
jgi:hypothetical protein